MERFRREMRIFVLEDDPMRIKAIWEAGIGQDLTVAKSCEEAKRKWQGPYDLVLLDHDLGGEVFADSSKDNTGAGFARWLVESDKEPGVGVIHSYNPVGAKAMGEILNSNGWKMVRVPFGPTLLEFVKVKGGEV